MSFLRTISLNESLRNVVVMKGHIILNNNTYKQSNRSSSRSGAVTLYKVSTHLLKALSRKQSGLNRDSYVAKGIGARMV